MFPPLRICLGLVLISFSLIPLSSHAVDLLPSSSDIVLGEIPLPQGFIIDENASSSFDTPSGVISTATAVFSFADFPSITLSQLQDYYNTVLPPLGWKLDSMDDADDITLAFNRDTQHLRIILSRYSDNIVLAFAEYPIRTAN